MWKYKALLKTYTALLRNNKALIPAVGLLMIYQVSFAEIHKALLQKYRALLRKFRALIHVVGQLMVYQSNV